MLPHGFHLAQRLLHDLDHRRPGPVAVAALDRLGHLGVPLECLRLWEVRPEVVVVAGGNFMFALVLSGASTKTLPVAIFDFVGYASIDWGGLMAAASVVTLPIMVVALFVQRYIVSGLTAGATKG